MKKCLTVVVVFILCIGCFAPAAMGATLTSVEIGQTVQTDDRLHVFFTLTDENGKLISEASEGDVELSIGAERFMPTLQSVAESDMRTGYVFAVDISKSLKEKQFETVRAALRSWAGGMKEGDMAAVMTFGEQISVLTDFTDDAGALSQIIDGMSPTDNKTQLYNGMIKALDLAKRQSANLPPLRTVVVLSDGVDDYTAGAAVSELTEKARDGGVPIYVVGVHGKNNGPALSELGGVARLSGGALYNVSGDALTDGYNEVYASITGSYIATVPLTGALADGSTRSIALSVIQDGVAVEDSLDIRLRAVSAPEPTAEPVVTEPEPTVQPEPEPEPESTKTPAFKLPQIGISPETLKLIAIIAGSVLVTAAAVLIILNKRKQIKAREAAERESERQMMSELDRSIRATGMMGMAGGTDARASGAASGTDSTLSARGATNKLGGEGEGTVVLRTEDQRRLTLILTDVKNGMPYSAVMNRRVQVGRVKIDGRGNDLGNQIIIPDKAVSAKHCLFTMEEDRLWLRDLNSSNGTYVMGQGGFNAADSTGGRPVRNGDRIRLGETELAVQLKEG